MEDPLNALSELFTSDCESDDDVIASSSDVQARKPAAKHPQQIQDEVARLEEQVRQLKAQLASSNQNVPTATLPRQPNASRSERMPPQIAPAPRTATIAKSSNGKTTDNRSSTSSSSIKSKEPQRPRGTAVAPPTKKPRLAHTPKALDEKNLSKPKAAENRQQHQIQQQKAKQKQQQKQRHPRALEKDTESGFKDGFSGLNLVSPKVSSQFLEERMKDRKFVKLHLISHSMTGFDINDDWVTIAVVVNKIPAKKGSNGKTYSVWKLSDLTCGNENETIGLFLFGNVHDEHWKVQQGSAIAILNASIMPSKDKYDSRDVAITVDNPQKLMELGVAKDFGVCQGSRKSDGQQCSNYVNKKYGEYCEYHIQRAYKKARSQRMEFQSGYGAPTNNMMKVKKEIAHGVYHYQGKTVTTDIPKDRKREQTSKKILQAKIKQEEGSDSFKEMLQFPTVGARNLAKYLAKSTEKPDAASQPSVKEEGKARKRPSAVPSPCLQDALAKTSQQRKDKNDAKNKDIKSLLDRKPFLSGGDGDFIEFVDSDDSITSNALDNRFDKENMFKSVNVKQPISKTSSVSNDEAKTRALAHIRKHGPNKVKDPKEQVRKALATEMREVQPHETTTDGSNSVLSTIFGPLDLTSDQGKKLLNAESSHVGSVKEACAEQMEQYFSGLEKKERYEEKMSSITEMNVTLVCCKECRYMAESASMLCREQNHKTVRVQGKKRFFECKQCKQRTISYKKLPTDGCKNCGGNSFNRTSMFKESNGPKIGGETLLVRGQEQKFINS